jgi:alkanesulfonate monooxygenase SsuD/methylene tetrahydromethanopterin reductase-like flavin-dependent oxidoreductase (luciferase family)
MRDVTLDQPPEVVPPVLAGVRGPRSLAMAGRSADGVVLAEGAGPEYVEWALDQAGRPRPFRVSVFTALCVTEDAREAHQTMAPFLAGMLGSPNPALERHSHIEEMRDSFVRGGVEALAGMPAAWWHEVGAIGTFSDAVEHVESLVAAGAHDVSLFPAADVDVARSQLDDVARLAAAVR